MDYCVEPSALWPSRLELHIGQDLSVYLNLLNICTYNWCINITHWHPHAFHCFTDFTFIRRITSPFSRPKDCYPAECWFSTLRARSIIGWVHPDRDSRPIQPFLAVTAVVDRTRMLYRKIALSRCPSSSPFNPTLTSHHHSSGLS